MEVFARPRRPASATARALLAVTVVALGACGGPGASDPGLAWSRAAGEPPRATREPHETEVHGDFRADPYFWLRDRDDPRVVALLEAENRYLEQALAPVEDLRRRLESEMTARAVGTIPMAPFEWAGYRYFARQEGEYPSYYRARTEGGPEQLLLDGREICSGHGHCRIELQEPDSRGRVLPWAIDVTGGRRYTVRFLDMETGESLPDELTGPVGYAIFGPRAFPSVVWAADDATLFYPSQDPQTMRTRAILRHRLGTDPAGDVAVHVEDDEGFWTMVGRTRSGRFLVIYSFHPDATDCRILEADRPGGEFRRIAPRETGREIWVEDSGDELILRVRGDGGPMRVVRAPVDDPSPPRWRGVREPGEGVTIEDALPTGEWVTILERTAATPRLVAVDLRTGEERHAEFDEEAFRLFFDMRQDPGGEAVRLHYSSLTTPRTLLAWEPGAGDTRELAAMQPLPGYDPSLYRTWRTWATARDGVRVPVTLVARRDRVEEGGNPTLLEGYGTYGVTVDPRFDPLRLSLLDRGFVYGIAHLRGGGALGREWYEAGRGAHKIRTFHDFVDAAEHLVATGVVDPERLYATGISAGGAVVGAALNMAPELFHGAVARVPALDLVNSMLDPTIPLVSGEYPEWGDPRDPEAYRAMLAWSPYDNVSAQAYPHVLALAGFNDRQVGYWEPAKWVARLRAERTDGGLTLLRTHMEQGHGGNASVSARVEDEALAQAFLLGLAGRD